MRARPPMLLIATAAVLMVSLTGCEAKVYGAPAAPTLGANVTAPPESPHGVPGAAFDGLPARIAQATEDAAVNGAQAAIDSAAANVDVLKGQEQEAISTLDELKTALAKAERDLSFTVIRAPLDGVIGNRAVQTGDYVQTGQRLASLVPLDAVYVNANFKETQLRDLRIRQPVDLDVDMYGGKQLFKGRISGFTEGTGSTLALLPPENATGNFIKVVQRLPVRIDLVEQRAHLPGHHRQVAAVDPHRTEIRASQVDGGAHRPVDVERVYQQGRVLAQRVELGTEGVPLAVVDEREGMCARPRRGDPVAAVRLEVGGG